MAVHHVSHYINKVLDHLESCAQQGEAQDMTDYNRTPAQLATIRDLAMLGFQIDQEERSQVRMVRGNDYRLVLMNGQQKRAMGARR